MLMSKSNRLLYISRMLHQLSTRGYSSVVEHSTADREVPGSNPGVPLPFTAIIYSGHIYLNIFPSG